MYSRFVFYIFVPYAFFLYVIVFLAEHVFLHAYQVLFLIKVPFMLFCVYLNYVVIFE